MEYLPMVPPFKVEDFSKLKKKEAQEHFDWYVNEIPNRMEILKTLYEQEGNNPELLNFTPESLISLWSWFIPKVKIMKLSKQQFQQKQEQYPEWIWDSLDDWELDIESLSIAMDIGIYFAETLIREHPELEWGFVTKPKSYVDLNKPTLLGFKSGADLCPSRILYTLTLKVIRQEKNTRKLFDTFEFWSNIIKKSSDD